MRREDWHIKVGQFLIALEAEVLLIVPLGLVWVEFGAALADLVEDDRTLDTGVGRDLADRGAQRGGDDVRAGLLVTG